MGHVLSSDMKKVTALALTPLISPVFPFLFEIENLVLTYRFAFGALPARACSLQADSDARAPDHTQSRGSVRNLE